MKFNTSVIDLTFRKVVWWVTLAVIPLWLVLGLDSGIVMVERAILNLPLAFQNYDLWVQTIYEAYGKSFHFSTYIIYGVLFVFISKHLVRLNVVRFQNVVYTVFLVALNAMSFEWLYMSLLIHYQVGRNLLEWFISDIGFLYQYVGITVFGLLGLLMFLTEPIKFKPNKKLLLVFLATVGAFLLWIYYPLPTVQAQFNGWTSTPFFPQTHYAYIDKNLYIPNDLLHIINITSKALLATLQLYFIRSFKREPTV